MSETLTPRTDAEVNDLAGMRERGESYTEPVSSAFARQLETALHAMTSERDALLAEQKTLTEVINIQASRDKPIRDNLIKRTTELTAANEKLAYVHSMGLRFGMMTSSDRPKPYLMHTWTDDSDHERMFREWSHSIGWEQRLTAANAEIARLREAVKRRDGVIELMRNRLISRGGSAFLLESIAAQLKEGK